MTSFAQARRRLLLSLLVCLAVFACIAIIYIHRDRSEAVRQLKIHAAIIADDVWAVNPSGAEPYLQLAMLANSYKSLTITQQGGEPFVHVESPALDGFEKLLFQLQLIRDTSLSTEIIYNDQQIGILSGIKHVRVIYPLANILIFLLLIMLTIDFFIYLFSNRKFLEQQVLERTRNLQESERRFHDLVNLLPEMVWETDNLGRITYANQFAIQRLRLTSDVENPRTWFERFIPEQHEMVTRYFKDMIQGQDLGLREFRALDKDDKPFPVLLRSSPILQGTDIIGTRTIAIDVSERYALEEQLRRAQKMKAIGLMAGGVAHDLNNILSGVVNYPELLLIDLPQDSPLRRPLEAMRKSGMQAAEVVADLLTVARGVAATKVVANPHALITEYLDSPEFLQLTTVYPDLRCTTQLDPGIHNISCSPVHVKKCLMNLVTNAAEAMNGIGTITISTANRSINSIDVHKDDQFIGEFAVITVADSGSGIPEQDLKHIFEPFYTKKTMGRSGTGLGLAVVWNTMKDHDGNVLVTSNTTGTTFELFFPSTREVKRIIPDATDLTVFRGNGETVLIVDDEAQQRDIASQILTNLGYEISTAASGEEAIEFVQNKPTKLLLLDMIMSPGIDGRETYKRILKLYPGQKAIIVSGFSQTVDVKESLHLGAGGFVSKPYTMEQLGRIVHNVMYS